MITQKRAADRVKPPLLINPHRALIPCPVRCSHLHRKSLHCSSVAETPCISSGDETTRCLWEPLLSIIWMMEPRAVTCAAAPTPEQAEALKEVMQAFNAACNFV